MSPEIEIFNDKMLKTIEVVKANFAAVRAGRANAGVLDRINVEYYGTPTPLAQVAAIASPDPRTLTIQPWDASLLKAIEKAIQISDLGINPQNDGTGRFRFAGDARYPPERAADWQGASAPGRPAVRTDRRTHHPSCCAVPQPRPDGSRRQEAAPV